MCSLVTLSKHYSTKSKMFLAESFGQRFVGHFYGVIAFLCGTTT
ncbi:hypothetical protein CPS_2245 [Colwellia psychrerythraea 34H]|uniref:Uncharacterized protein n=1 Tax=Colwellia psychrerythraea (strain 34H / ATCC BAA-681) TaxID=167879 RepID=Q482P7_COLP3|nr:hypothetical protein CPS_2245 [Colwellia psychrerythraea 34H]